MLSVFISVNFVQVAIEYFVFDEKYFLPLRFRFPFLPHDDIFIYCLNFCLQVYAIFTALAYCVEADTLWLVLKAHFVVHLDAIKILLDNMMIGIDAANFNTWLKTVSSEICDAKM